MNEQTHVRLTNLIKRILSLILAICLLTTMIPVSFADSKIPDTTSAEEVVPASVPDDNTGLGTTPADVEVPDATSSEDGTPASVPVENTGTDTTPADLDVPDAPDIGESVSASASDENTGADTTPTDEETSDANDDGTIHKNLTELEFSIGGTPYPGFEFDPQKSEYPDFNFWFQGSETVVITMRFPDINTRYFNLFLNGTAVTGGYGNNNSMTEKKITNALSASAWKKLNTSVEHTITLAVGPTNISGKTTDTIPSDADVYTFKFRLLPYLESITVYESGTTTKIGFDSGSVYSTTDSFLAFLKGEDYAPTIHATAGAIDITPVYKKTFKTNKLYYKIGGSETEDGDENDWTLLSSTKITNINLQSAKPENSDHVTIWLKVEDAGEHSHLYQIKVFPIVDYTPTITTQPEGFNDEKGSVHTLSAAAVAEDPSMEITYQWQSTGSMENQAGRDIPGATGSTYTVPTDKAGSYYYRCVATVIVDGISYSVPSKTVECIVQLSYVNGIEVIRPLGSFIPTSTGEYKTEYRAGESVNPIYIGLPSLEPGTNYAFEILCGTTDLINEAVIFTTATAKYSSQANGDYEGKTYNGYVIENIGQLSVGDNYIFVRVTAVDKSNSENKSNTVVSSIKLTCISEGFDWTKGGTGTATDPYLITDASDLEYIRTVVNEWNNRLTGVCFRFDADITLPEGWTPIGGGTKFEDWRVFSGQIDGDGHTLTVATGGKPLFNLVSEAVIKNLNIYGKEIDGCGLINSSFVDYGLDNNYNTGVPETVTLENVHLVRDSSTRRSGFMEGSGSGRNTITLRNCTVGPEVVIGYTGTEFGIGSFVGDAFNGQMTNCYSAATVKGRMRVGGLAASKGQSMGLCTFTNCGFTGTIEASGEWVGGIIARGYSDSSAPNTMCVSFNNCYVNATISGKDYVGGIFGSEGGVRDAFNKCILSNSFFYGTITSTGQNVGGIIGYYNGVNTLQEMENNYFVELSGRTQKVIGNVGAYVINSGKTPFPSQAAADEWFANTGRGFAQTEYDPAEVVSLLNNGSSSLKNWIVGPSGHPEHSTDPVMIRLEVNGEWPNQQLGHELNATGVTFTAVWSNGKTEIVPTGNIAFDGYDKDTAGPQTVTAKYLTVRAEFKVTVLKPEGTIKVKFSLLGDTAHGAPTTETGTHTLAGKNLAVWIPEQEYEISTNDTVLKLIQKAIADANKDGTIYTLSLTSEDNYIESITKDGLVLKEFTNGNKSGWQFTVNGSHGGLGVSEQYLNNDDVVVFHYTDDYTAEGTIGSDNGDDDKKDDPPAGDITKYKSILTSTLKYLADNVPSPVVSSTKGEWAVLAQARGDALANATKQTYLTNLWIYADGKKGELHDTKYTEYSRVVLALTSVGIDASKFKSGKVTYDFVAPLLDENYKKVSEQGNNGTAFALIALDSGNYLDTAEGKKARATWIDTLSKTQLSNGAWAIESSDNTADFDATAMVIQALAPYYRSESIFNALGANTSHTQLKAMVDNAVTWLKQQSYNNSQAAVQLVVAFTALDDSDGADAALANLLGYQVGSTGSFGNTGNSSANQMSTEQAAYALVAYDRYKNSRNSLYNMTDITLSSADLDLVRTITVECGEGGTISPGTTSIQKGKDAEFSITAKAGYEIKDVKVDGKSVKDEVTNGKYTFKAVTANHTISAEFEKVSGAYGITTSSNTGGFISPSSATVLEGDSKTFTITPYDGYKIKDVKIDGVSKGSITYYTFTDMKADHTITAVFEPSNGITVYFTLLGDSNHGSTSNPHTLSSGLRTWISRHEVTVSKGATVYDVFTQVLSQYGYGYVGAENNYVETIITPSGQRLSEFTNGSLSGWMYTVNGVHPTLGLRECTVYNGNDIVWHYTDDYTKEKGGTGTSTTGATQITPTVTGSTATVTSSDLSDAISAAINANSGTILIAPQGSAAASTLTVNLPTSTLYSAVNNGVGVTVQSGAGTVTIPSYALSGIANAAGGSQLNITTTIKNSQQGVNLLSGRTDVTATQLANSSVTEVTMTSGYKNITNWGGRAITLSLTVDSTNFTAGNRYTVYQISADGSVEVLNGYCSRQNGKLQVEVTTTHLSTFVVVPGTVASTTASNLPFTDVSTTDWFYNEVAYAYNNGLFYGDTATTFAPYAVMNRAMLVTVLHRYEGTPITTSSTGFNDVPTGQWYSNGVAWASSKGVVNGKGAGKFDPYGNITREEIAVILYRYAKIKGWDVSASASLASFSDGARTSDWATRAMQWAYAKGIINGKGGGTLDPSGKATRAEVAAMLMRFIQTY